MKPLERLRPAFVGGTYKFEARNSKHETISNDQNPNDQNSVERHPFRASSVYGLFLSLTHSSFEFVSARPGETLLERATSDFMIRDWGL